MTTDNARALDPNTVLTDHLTITLSTLPDDDNFHVVTLTDNRTNHTLRTLHFDAIDATLNLTDLITNLVAS